MPRQNKHWFWYSDRPYLHSGEISDSHFRALGYLMTGLAGAINAGGFFAVNSFTSHITGALSHTANELYARQWFLALLAMAGVVAFVLGSAHASWLILWAKRQKFRSSYGMSMWLEALYLLFFGLLGFGLEKGWSLVHPTVWLLSFIMGMHNTVLTVLSGSVIRSTHMTGAATDLGIELSKMLYYRRGCYRHGGLSIFGLPFHAARIADSVYARHELGGLRHPYPHQMAAAATLAAQIAKNLCMGMRFRAKVFYRQSVTI